MDNARIVLDDYGDERWDLLPKEIETCLRKISESAGESIPWDRVEEFRKRLKTTFEEYHKDCGSRRRNLDVNGLSGIEFEKYIAHVLKLLGYEVSGTPATGDQGADLLARKDGQTIAVQAKRYRAQWAIGRFRKSSEPSISMEQLTAGLLQTERLRPQQEL